MHKMMSDGCNTSVASARETSKTRGPILGHFTAPLYVKLVESGFSQPGPRHGRGRLYCTSKSAFHLPAFAGR